MSSKDSALYGFQRPKRMRGDKEIASNTSLSFASQLGSLISTPAGSNTTKSKHSALKPTKEDIFKIHKRPKPKRPQREEGFARSIAQKHTTDGEGLERDVWERSKRKMEEKARLYAAIKRGDVEDLDERYAVDFDRKWAEGHDDQADEDLTDDEDEEDREMVEYTDEFGRTRTGTRAEAAREERIRRGQADMESDRFTARPSAPTNVIYGDTIQHQAFNPDMSITEQMEELAKKRDRSLTPPPDSHFDARQEIRQKGTGFFQFSGDAAKRKRQMDDLEAERAETERKRKEREKTLRDEVVARDREFRDDDEAARQKRKADDFLEALGEELSRPPAGESGMDAMQRIEAALANEPDES